MIKKLLLLVIFLILIANSLAFTCNYNTQPYISDRIYWNCNNITAKQCISYVKYDNDIIQTNPVPENIRDVGIVDKFQVNSGTANIYFRGIDLRENKNVTFGVQCQNEKLEKSIKPKYKPLYDIFDRAIFLKNNADYIIGIIVFIFAVVIIGAAIWYIIKRQ